MAMGALLVLFGIVLACKLRDSGRAMAQGEPVPPISPEPASDAKKPIDPPAAKVSEEPGKLPPIITALPSEPLKPPAAPSGSEVKRAGFETSDAPPPPPPSVSANTGASPVASGPPSAPSSPPISPPPAPDMKITVTPASPPPPDGGPASPPPAATESSLPMPSVTPPLGGLPPASPPKPTEMKEKLPSVKVEVRDGVEEPPLAPAPGPVVIYRVATSGETFKTLSRKTLGTVERWSDIHKLNPALKAAAAIAVGTTVRLPGDACVVDEEMVKPLPTLRPRTMARVKPALPLTGTYPVALDDKKVLTLPQAILKQLGSCDTVMVSPGSDKCLWLTNQAHLDRLAQKLEKSPARESDKSGFKRLYYAQTVKAPIKDGRVAIADRLAAFAGLNQEVVLVGIDDHFEVWDAARWRRYTQAKKAAPIED
jgi:MraZ protein